MLNSSFIHHCSSLVCRCRYVYPSANVTPCTAITAGHGEIMYSYNYYYIAANSNHNQGSDNIPVFINGITGELMLYK